MESIYVTSVLRLLLAFVAGALIGLERTTHGRPAGFRTHTLVCAASALLMLLTVFQWDLVPEGYMETVRVDPTRMAQGIMTGIGFLGAGVIMKERLSVRGLTTAASIWMTASLGIIIGMGLYVVGLMGVILTLVALVGLRWIEGRLPAEHYAELILAFQRDAAMDEPELRRIIEDHGIHTSEPSYQVEETGSVMQYRMTVHTGQPARFGSLVHVLRARPEIQRLSLQRTGA